MNPLFWIANQDNSNQDNSNQDNSNQDNSNQIIETPAWPTVKRYLVSTLLTFLTGFIPVIIAYFESSNLSFGEMLQGGAILGVVLSAGRAGFKAILEYIVPLVPKFIEYLKGVINTEQNK